MDAKTKENYIGVLESLAELQRLNEQKTELMKKFERALRYKLTQESGAFGAVNYQAIIGAPLRQVIDKLRKLRV